MDNVDLLADVNPDALIADDFDEALIGYVERCGMEPTALYDVNKIIELLMERDGMTEEDAWEHYTYNMLGSWVGELTPVYATFFDNGDNLDL